MSDQFTYFDEPDFAKIVVAILLLRYGPQKFEQADFDQINGRRMIEDGYPDGSIELKLETQS